ncbi:hypothetical protein V6Z12_A13G096600 [Gossypium hirsutum]
MARLKVRRYGVCTRACAGIGGVYGAWRLLGLLRRKPRLLGFADIGLNFWAV